MKRTQLTKLVVEIYYHRFYNNIPPTVDCDLVSSLLKGQ